MNDINSKPNVIKDFARHEKDTGSPEVQIALLSHRIKYLTEHLGTHRKDKHCQRGLLKLVGSRSSLLKYLNRIDNVRFTDVVKRLSIRVSSHR